VEEVAISRKPADVKDVAASYNAVKEFEGRKYTGMRVGGSHSWYYRQGEWREMKVSPDRWKFTYAANKLRVWNAPEGSGAPVGTEYHWYILAHQNVRKLNANEYTTSMTGVKYKLAHRRANSGEWSASERAQLRRLITIFEENIIQLKHELGEANEEPRVMPQEGGPSVMTTNRRRKAITGGRWMPPKNPPPSSTTGQPPLETYMSL
jgi:hypothetical protein